jgi:membrane-associated phospholipid phosphatase
MRQVRYVIATALFARVALAQTPADTTKPIADSRLFVKSDFYILAGFTAATIAMFPLDRKMASTIRDEDLVANRTLDRTASVFRFFGSPGPLLIGSSMYTVGRLTHVRRAAELGLHGTEAILVGGGIAYVIKGLAGRERPYVEKDTNPHSFGFLRGLRQGHDMSSFPSGHTTAAFAAAAAVTAETRDWWPQHHKVIGTAMYTGAALVGISRMYNDAHWASDVVMGAAIGTFAGQKTVRFNHTHTGNRLDRWMLGSGAAKGASFRIYMGDEHSYGVIVDLLR